MSNPECLPRGSAMAQDWATFMAMGGIMRSHPTEQVETKPVGKEPPTCDCLQPVLDEPPAECRRQLERAVERKEIGLCYQPIFEIRTFRIRAFEALARWRKPDGQSVSPAIFFPAAEHCGLAETLSEQLLDRACRDARLWPDDVLLSFNISPSQLERAGAQWVPKLVDIAERAGFQPSRLQIEVTETAPTLHIDNAQRMLDLLRTAGVQLALDDFGAGYSNLALLTSCSFSNLKIDRSLVQPGAAAPRQRQVLRMIIAMAKALKMTVTAEGIETEDQRRLLESLGCPLGQGFLVSQAVPAAEALNMVR
ncbi:EAL domain-containing protein [Consotaella aegiceratis]|uniref:EAL domain-containing protein n=1 Tax=Consotaella aegiceratis TaxID=3097961 RepID=UPI002F3ECD65